MTRRIDVSRVPAFTGTLYPPPYHTPCLGRVKQALGDAAGLTQFGVNLLRLDPGVWSAQRHWHTREDEFIYVLEGAVNLITDAGEETLHAGDAAGFRAGEEDGHHLVNKSDAPALVLEVGTRTSNDVAHYPEADLVAVSKEDGFSYTRKDGSLYTGIRRRTTAEE
jgi:uncharacterized cupin superfamily protein